MRIITGSILLASLFIVCSCGEKSSINGKEFIPRNDMLEMMLEMHLIDGITNDMKYYRKYNQKDSIDLYGSVYQKYGYSMQEFDTTLGEYARHPELLDELYNDVLTRLNLMQDDLNQIRVEEEKERRRSMDSSKRKNIIK